MKRITIVLFFFVSANCFGEFRLGLENIPPNFFQDICKKKTVNIGLITNQTGKDQSGNRNVEILQRKKGVNIQALFAPEHGIDGTIKAEKEVLDAIDKKTRIPIISLYRNYSGKRLPTPKINHIDALVFDIQDSGMRHYTFISTLFHALEAAACLKKTIVILDRPNPLGFRMEGPLVENNFKSFISIAPIPLRHGLTIGEIAHYFNRHLLQKPANLHVVKMHGYNRKKIMKQLVAPLSTNIQNIYSCYGYSFLGLLGEVRPFTLSMGTKKAFQRILIPDNLKVPKKQWEKLSSLLKPLGLNSHYYRGYSKRKKQYCSGIEIFISDINQFNSFHALLTILQYFHQTGISLTFSRCFHLGVGTDKIQQYCLGKISPEKLATLINTDLKAFNSRARNCLLYNPSPKCCYLKAAKKQL